jgi:predicted XRE-type DNA-binding protein
MKMARAMKITEGSDNVFRDVGFAPDVAENLLRRTDLMIEIEKWFVKSELSQSAAAELLGVTQPRFNHLLKGKVQNFTIDALVNMLTRAGMRVKITVRKAA